MEQTVEATGSSSRGGGHSGVPNASRSVEGKIMGSKVRKLPSFDVVVWERKYVGYAYTTDTTYFPTPAWSGSGTYQRGKPHYGDDGSLLASLRNFREAYEIMSKIKKSSEADTPYGVKLPDGSSYLPSKGSKFNIGIVFRDVEIVI